MPQILLCCVLALLLAALGLLLRSLRRRSRPSGGNETLKVLLVCFFTCGILLHLPMYAAAYAGEHLSWLKALLGAVHHTLRMFVLDGELDPIHEFAMSRPAVWSDLYFGAAIVVYLVSPLLTFSVVLSFFKNLSALWRYAFRRCTELYVFSELNEDSLYLAGSIKAAHPKGLVVFTDVYENESEEFGEQMAAAHRLGAACFKADIALLRLRRSDRSRPVYFFLMGRDKAENIHQAVLLTRRWGTRSNMAPLSLRHRRRERAAVPVRRSPRDADPPGQRGALTGAAAAVSAGGEALRDGGSSAGGQISDLGAAAGLGPVRHGDAEGAGVVWPDGRLRPAAHRRGRPA